MSAPLDAAALDAIVAAFQTTAAHVLDELDGKLDQPSRNAHDTIVTAGGLVDALHSANKTLARRVRASTPSVGAIALGMAIVVGAYGRKRFDLIDRLAVDIRFARFVAERVLEVMLEESTDPLDRAAVTARFRTLLDAICDAVDSDDDGGNGHAA